MIVGRCPVCGSDIETREKIIRGKKIKLFACKNANWKSEDGELWELREDATCSFRIWQNALSKYGKYFSYKEIKELLSKGELEVGFVSKKYGKKINYTKTVVLNNEYGVSVLWES
jgi:hypothetical protein